MREIFTLSGILGLILLSLGLLGQSNEIVRSVNVKQGLSDNSVTISSTGIPPNILVSAIGVGYDTLHISPNAQSNSWDINFKPSVGFRGEIIVPYEYAIAGPIPGLNLLKYAEIHYQIKNSIISTSDDFFVSFGGQDTLDVLSNDLSPTDGNLDLSEITYANGGSAEIVDNKIVFALDTGADQAYIQYMSQDSTGNQEPAYACIIRNESLNQSNNRFIHNKESLLIHLDQLDYTILNFPINGNLESLNAITYRYTANTNFVGSDLISFNDSNGDVTDFEITVYDKVVNEGFLRPDKIYSPRNNTVVFNARENDLKSSGTIVDFSSELSHLGNGVFSYTPTPNFEGDLNFFYKLFTGVAYETADIEIRVGDQAPLTSYNYNFGIYKDEHLELDYSPEFSGYFYNLIVPPSNGSITILSQNDNVAAECENIVGNNKIVYSSNPSFSGVDQFDIEYCTNSGICEIVKIEVTVSDIEAASCICYNDCMWPGDANNDGICNVQDYLLTYLSLGNSGPERNSTSSSWEGYGATSWNFENDSNNEDLKYADANGDGVINNVDIQVINDNYLRYNDLIGASSFTLGNLPISLVPQQTQVDSGEWLYVDILLGDPSFPAIDFHGIGMNINFSPELMDSSSVIFTAENDSWIANQAPVNSMFDVPEDGLVNIGLSSVSNISPSGEGKIGVLAFIVEEDLAGWRVASNIINAKMSTSNVLFMNESGTMSRLPDAETTIDINIDPTRKDLYSSVDIFPNPSSDFIDIYSDQYNLAIIELFSITGTSVFNQSFIGENKSYKLDLTNLLDGMYFAKITMEDGQSIVKKIQKFNK